MLLGWPLLTKWSKFSRTKRLSQRIYFYIFTPIKKFRLFNTSKSAFDVPVYHIVCIPVLGYVIFWFWCEYWSWIFPWNKSLVLKQTLVMVCFPLYVKIMGWLLSTLELCFCFAQSTTPPPPPALSTRWNYTLVMDQTVISQESTASRTSREQ